MTAMSVGAVDLFYAEWGRERSVSSTDAVSCECYIAQTVDEENLWMVH